MNNENIMHFTNNFTNKWHTIRKKKNSLLVAGLDPVHTMNDSSSEGELLAWSKRYISAVAEHASALKINYGFFAGISFQSMKEIISYAKEHELLCIVDSKIADIGSTNKAWLYHFANMGFDAATIAPYANNLQETITYAKELGIATISVVLMSAKSYLEEAHFISPGDTGSFTLLEKRIIDTLRAKADALVVGGTLAHDSQELKLIVKHSRNSEHLFLVPGIGAQGGEVQEFFKSGINQNRCMINIGRALMYPQGFQSTPKEQERAALFWKEEINKAALG